ncbi:putative DNA oxidative demethylase [Helianthus annuus]|uniref:DUF4057 domain-containing protein n=2 Tax=Helianthus annuus TaxID=4232 RepID=A0A251URN4_HELAN|nr:uncharacterized protein LOC110941087 [Helianthus annuus]KAJ0570112.1 putative DNA oxidative demethylase [Helianthus annuus]KAJ0576860.1 putative DNA oxidative demethylase [Helianthus annuus]KAJ0584451.1 putative DNA oxidative demethylase [Helianthus annuus]KAJ0747071.1 putative DNA oxidative demethylase [Helianthus annuus]KAJ0918813.1 putative DNA oxidative demethylase [Helianthus annuus]
MERKTPVRKPHSATSDLLSWPETPVADSVEAPSAAARSHQPSDGISKVVFGGQVSDEEFQTLNKRKPVSGYKLKEITGSGIFAAGGENDEEEADAANPTSTNKTGLRMYQQTVAGMSHISFGGEESVSPKKALSEAKQRELSGTLDNELDSTLKKQFSTAKNKELSGHNIFGAPPEIQPRPLAARALALRESITIGESTPNNTNAAEQVKTAKKIPSQKFTELSGNNIFKGDEVPASAEKHMSSAKLREMSGSNIFADGKAESRDFLGARKPPGGESSIALV